VITTFGTARLSLLSSTSTYETATDLLESVQKEDRDERTIESLIQALINNPSLNVFDPADCLYGSLFCTLYSFTPGVSDAPAPLWERISLRKQNIKGQQYSGSGGSGSVINYAQIWAEAMPKGFDEKVGGWRSRFSVWEAGSPASSATGNRLRTCPDDYIVTVSGASLDVFGWQVLSLPISGQSMLRVLYADPRLRILVSPQSSSDSFTNREWESSGLIVVQCRSDLVATSGQLIDLTVTASANHRDYWRSLLSSL
jgi:hypothetical protein